MSVSEPSLTMSRSSLLMSVHRLVVFLLVFNTYAAITNFRLYPLKSKWVYTLPPGDEERGWWKQMK